MIALADWLSRSAISALPCENVDKLMRRCEPDTGRPICNACKRRPAVLAMLEAVRAETIEECISIITVEPVSTVAGVKRDELLWRRIRALLEKP